MLIWNQGIRLFVLLIAILAAQLSPGFVQAQPTSQGFIELENEKLALGDTRELRLAIKSEARCELGDFDAIDLEMAEVARTRKNPGNTVVLLTVENLGTPSEEFKPIVKNISNREVSPKRGVRIQLPKVTKPVLAGVFVCSHEMKAGEPVTCLTKEHGPYKKIFTQYRVDVNPATKMGHFQSRQPQVKDRVYFFRYLLLVDGDVYFSKVGMSDPRYDQLSKFLGTLVLPGEKGFDPELKLVRSFGLLGSVPLSVKEGTIYLDLPHYEQKKCTRWSAH